MARSMWKGTLGFGLVSVPVKLYSAVTSRSVHFHQLHGADNGRIRQKRVCSADGEEVPFEEIVKGYEIAPERYVVVEDSELAALAPKATQTIEIEDFVEIGEIDRIYFDQPYYVVPDRGGARPYRLLLEAMLQTGKVAIARVVLRSRERLVAVHPHGDVLMMTTLSYADEINPTSELSELNGEQEAVGERELEVARRLIESLAEPFEMGRYEDTYREAVLELIERKASGEEVVVEPGPAVQELEAPDLMSALQASLEKAQGRGGEGGRAKGKAKARKQAPAPKPARAKTR
ncbi:MAG TPA: Ku protein [Solirubrobacteraceae bacterium]|nr:Ku protein [Solirubrobacteraceae bacterium]